MQTQAHERIMFEWRCAGLPRGTERAFQPVSTDGLFLPDTGMVSQGHVKNSGLRCDILSPSHTIICRPLHLSHNWLRPVLTGG